MLGICRSLRGKQFSAGTQFPFILWTARIMDLQLKDKVVLVTGAGHITGQHLFADGGYVHLDRALT